MRRLEGKAAVVTGGGAGIGRGLVLALAERGCGVMVADIDGSAAEAVAEEARERGVPAEAIACDVGERGLVEALADAAWRRFGQVDLCFANAGVSTGRALLDAETRDLDWILRVNLYGVWHCLQVFGRRFAAGSTPAHLSVTGSEHSLGFAHAGAGFYTASKHAVLGLVEVLRHELPAHVTASILCPGLTATELWRSARHRPPAFGGAKEGSRAVKAVMDQGMDPLEIGRHALDAIASGAFYLVTHPHARRFAEARLEEIRAAFDAQAPYSPDAERYDVESVVRRLSS